MVVRYYGVMAAWIYRLVIGLVDGALFYIGLISVPDDIAQWAKFLAEPTTRWVALGFAVVILFGLVATFNAYPVRRKGATMPMSRALFIVGGVRPRGDPEAYMDSDVDELMRATKEIRQAAVDGEIQIWGRKWMSHQIDDVHQEIPSDYWRNTRIDVGLLHPTKTYDKHVLGNPEIKFTDLRVNGHQILKHWPLNLWSYVRTRNVSPA